MSTLHTYDVVEVVQLGKHYQVKYLRSLPMGGWEDYSINFGLNDDLIPIRPLFERGKNKNKLKNNIARALTTCRNIALSNDWDYFITLTIDPKKYDRFDLSKFHKDVTSFFRSINRKYNCHIQFLLVPEQHKNGAWHMHGIVSNIPDELLEINDFNYLNFRLYQDKFGYCSLSPIKSQTAISFYITKHLGKQLYNGVIDLQSHLYYCSRGLNRGNIIAYLRPSDLPDNFSFQYISKDKSYKSSFFEDGSFLKSIGLI